MTFRPEFSTPSAPSLTPIDPGDFSTGGKPLEDILRQWLKRHRNPDWDSPNIVN